jgi:hypothetical protein
MPKTKRGPKPPIAKPGIREFKRAAGQLKKAGYTALGNRFKEALADRRRLMQRLERIAPDDPVLAELRERDGLKPLAKSTTSATPALTPVEAA